MKCWHRQPEPSAPPQPQPASDLVDSKSVTCTKGMLADLLEREVKKEVAVANGQLVNKELRISEKGLELVAKDGRGSAPSVDVATAGVDAVALDLADAASAPKGLIAQVTIQLLCSLGIWGVVQP